MSLDVSSLPSELIATPQPLIGLSGLDINKNQVHKSIWDAFNNNRKPDRAPIQFKILPGNYEFPVSKPKRQSYEWYHPKGILKRNWMLKHLHVLPAVVVLFQDIEWNDPQWSEKQLQCASLVQYLKNSLQGRSTRLAIVLLQKGAPLPPGEDLLASERVTNLTSVCDINAKMIFVLNHTDHLMGYILRLESAFLDIAQSYYAQMAKQIKMHRDQLSNTHQSLRIRHQFKLGFVSEMRLDFSTALKYYTQSYANLEDIRIVDTNCGEIKTVAGYINYKICKLMFKLNVPRDSITQFKTHIEKYKNRSGFKELLFEHYAWLSVQYSAFAELFCEAIKNGLPALQTQHPGIYYHKAGEYIGRRKEAFLQCCALSLSPTEPPLSPIANILYSDFFGVRGAKTGEPVSEQQIIAMVQEHEKTFNHSAAIITLLGQAMAQFKVYKCLRFRKKLAIDMAEEYLRCGDHSKALTLYSLMLSDYRVDKWYAIFTQVLLKTLRSAYLSASVTDFVCCSIEAMSPKIAIEVNERIIVLENLWKVFQNVPPVSQSQITPELKSNWEQQLINFIAPIYIDLDKISELLDCSVSFEKSQIKYEDLVKVELLIQSRTDVPLKLKNFSIIVNDSKTNYRLKASFYAPHKPKIVRKISDDSNDLLMNEIVEEELLKINPNEFMMEPKSCHKILFFGEPKQFMENEELQIVKLEIQIGSDKKYAVLSQSSTLNKINIFKNYNPINDYMANVPVNSSCYIVPTFHLSTQTNQNNQPMLVNEYFKVVTNLNNNFEICLQNVGISVTIPPNLRNKVFLTTDLAHPCQKLSSNVQIDIGDLQIQSSTSVVYYISSLVEGNIELTQKIWYQTEMLPIITSPTSPIIVNFDSPTALKPVERLKKHVSNHNIIIDYIEHGVKKVKEDTIIVPCVEEMKFNARLYTLSRQALLRAYKNEDFLLRVNMNVKAPCSIQIMDTYFISDHNIIERSYYGHPKISGKIVNRGDKLEDIRILKSENCTTAWFTYSNYINPTDMIFKNRNLEKSNPLKVVNKPEDVFSKCMLSKIPTNTTIIGSSSSQMQMTNLMNDENKLTSSLTGLDEFNLTNNSKAEEAGNAKIGLVSKSIYNKTIDAIHKTGNLRGFFKAFNGIAEATNLPIFGVYCVRWRRSGWNVENESKFVINGIEVIEPTLNIYCYLEEKMYVRVPVTFKILLTNPAAKVLHLLATLNNSDSFMFAGHKQINISIFSHSTYELAYNLYPLKAGWQPLPELSLEFNTQYESEKDEHQQNELNNLVKRWMPKRVFVHPPRRQII